VKTLKVSLFVSIGISALAYLALFLNDSIVGTRLGLWIVPLVKLQGVGIGAAYRWFPCQREGFDTGCEPFKVIPTIVVANSILYLSVIAPLGILITCFKKVGSRSTSQSDTL